MRRRSITALVSAMLLSACTLPAITVAPSGTVVTGPTTPGATPWAVLSSGPTTGGVARPAVQNGVTISGAVKVPAGIIAAGGMNLVAAGSGNLVAAGGMNYDLLAVDEAPAAGADVFLADAAGNPIPGLDKVKTDDKGNFTIPNVPADFTFVVAAEVTTKDGKKATFQTLTKPGKLGATAVVDAATTLVASNVLEGQKGSDLGEFNPAVFKTAAETTAKNLDADKLPDFSDRASVKARMAQLLEAVSELKESVNQLRSEISEVKKTLEDLRAALAGSRTQPGVAPMPGESPPPTGVFRTPPPPQPGESPRTGELPPPTDQPPTQPTAHDCVPANHQFILPSAEEAANVAYIEFKIPTPDKPRDQWMNASTAKRENDFWSGTPEGCPHLVLFKNERGEVLHAIPDFVIRVGSEKQVRFEKPTTDTGTYTPPPTTGTYTPPPTTGTYTPPPTTGTYTPPPTTGGTCTEPRFHRFTLRNPSDGFLLFDVPNSGDPPHHAAEGRRAADGSWEASVPEGCPHDIKLFDKDWQPLGYLKGYVIPVGAPADLELAI